MKFARILLCLTFALCSTGWAQLKWDSRNLDLHPSISDTEVVANFYFVNAGKRPVKIKRVTTSCGCTTASQDKEVYAPGEKGKITATLEIGGRTGVQEKQVFVDTDESAPGSWELIFKATIPEVLKVEPIFLNWSKGDALKPKTAEVRVMNNFPVHHLEITSTSPDMVAEVRHKEGSPDFQIVMTPKKSKDAINAGIEISPDFPKDSPKYFHIYTHVDN